MAGLAFIVSSADYSSKNLGQVTIAESPSKRAQRIVKAYTDIVGSTYSSELNEMVLSLITEGLIDKVKGLYPMLGSELNKLTINLLGGKSLLTKENASAATNAITFTNVANISALDTSDNANLFDVIKKNQVTFASIKLVKSGINTTKWTFAQRNGQVLTELGSSGTKLYIYYGGQSTLSYVNGSTITMTLKSDNTASNSIVITDNAEDDNFTNSATDAVNAFTASVSRYVGLTKGTYKNDGTADSLLASGNLNMIAYADMDSVADARKLDTILRAFNAKISRP